MLRRQPLSAYADLMQNKPSARFTRPEHIEMELVTVAYRNRSFPMHMHDQYVVGMMEKGSETLHLEGTAYLVEEGDLITINPGLAHSNSSLADEVLEYRVFYLPPDLVRRYTGLSGLYFGAPTRTDTLTSRKLLDLHRWFENGGGDRLEQETAFAEIIGLAFDGADEIESVPKSPETVKRARCFLDDNYHETFGLDAVARIAGVSKFHLVRSFKKTHGLSPFAYRTHRRIEEAKRRVLAGEGLAKIATDLGFSDQSHLTRTFQSIVGISPARYGEQ
ncbi:MAG: AraC family transcriptional regulator [Pseudomonadota bacterium]|nr:AraC family transcriptional regulator [Pseudomonadota bacterium]